MLPPLPDAISVPLPDVATFNRTHYDAVYGRTSADHLIDLVRRWRAEEGSFSRFLADATATHMSWHGLYYQGFAEQLAGRRVLELGCGDGTNACVMALLGADVTANDVSVESSRRIDEIASRTGLSRLHAAPGLLDELGLEDASFDFVVGKAFLHHLPHHVEASYLETVARVLRPSGEARFFEPAVNSLLLDGLRWLVPVPGRPSVLSRDAFRKWKDEDPHPDRDNSSEHYAAVGRSFFHEVLIVPMGSVERFYRFMPRSRFRRRYRQWSHRIDERLPMWLRSKAARSQLIRLRRPMGRAGAA